MATSSVTAAATIIPALVAAGYALVAKGDRYTCPSGFGTLSVKRRWEGRTVALIEVYGDCSRSQMIDELVRVVEALKAAGYPARRNGWEVSVDWSAGPVAAQQEAA
ncbi:hypothetical protein WMF38_56870 [Sorangium sp. So ce118]